MIESIPQPKVEDIETFLSLGTFRPPVNEKQYIAVGLYHFIEGRGFEPYGPPTVRYADHYEMQKDSLTDNWHKDACPYKIGPRGRIELERDYSKPSASSRYLALWASSKPTLIADQDKKLIYQPKPYEVVIINNDNVWHRRPVETISLEDERWFARVILNHENLNRPSKNGRLIA